MDWVEEIKRYKSYNEQEQKDKEIILTCISRFDDIWTRSNELAHLTSSAFVVNKDRDKVLMVHHNIYNAWSWTGGHADGDRDLLAVALRELREETGIHAAEPTAGIFSLDVLPVLAHRRRGHYVPAHLHLSVAFLVTADESKPLVVKEDENSAVKWVPANKVIGSTNEPHMQKLYEKLLTKIAQKEGLR